MSNVSTSQTTQRTDGRKIPVGLHFLLDSISLNGVAPLMMGFFLSFFPFAFQNDHYSPTMLLPFLWSDAGVATITKIEHGFDFEGQPEESIRYTYHDPTGNEYQFSRSTTRKMNFFVVGNQYPILKFQNRWKVTTLADLDWWERDSSLPGVLSLFALAGAFIAFGSLWFIIGYFSSYWKRELLRFGNYASGTFSHYETAPIYWRILGVKKKMFRFSTESVSEGESTEHYASYFRVRSKKESPQVDVFYDPLNPARAFVLQDNGESKHVRYSPQTGTFHVARWITVFVWFIILVVLAVLLYHLCLVVEMVLL